MHSTTQPSTTTTPTPSGGGAAPDRAERARRDRILLRRYSRTRDPALKRELVERFMPLARSLAWRYSSTSEPMEDLVQVASEGLVRALEGFDVSRSNAFSSYATPVILGALRHYFRDGTRSLHIPRGLQERIQLVASATEGASGELGLATTLDELAERTGLAREEVEEALEADANRNLASLDVPAQADPEESGHPLVELIGQEEDGFERVEASMAGSTTTLERDEREALRLRYEGDLTQREIGKRIGVSQMQVSRLLRRALHKLLASVRGQEGPRGGNGALPDRKAGGTPARA